MKKKTKPRGNKLKNHLKNQTSPYLLQHAENPVDWYPWGEEAFEKAKNENKPIFLSIGYSTCHWCHVMAHESFEAPEIAELLNRYFVSIKVDKEERPDIDSIYMSVCQAFTGNGGWPTSIFMTYDQKPFFAGTYFPKYSQYGMLGFAELLEVIHEKWDTDKADLINSAENIISHLNKKSSFTDEADLNLTDTAVRQYKQSYDERFGGFGEAPKFPTPHNLLFLLTYYEKSNDKEALKIVENTLNKMYCGGIFDHIGYGFSRYSTDRYFLVPHFEKMLYDNALLIISYCKAYSVTKNSFYLEVAEKTASYILREMTDNEGGFYSAQDADSEGEEGKYYVFEPSEIINILGEEIGSKFNKYYDITKQGNFEGKNIPNLLNNKDINGQFDSYLNDIYKYRLERTELHLDDKILTSWNSLMIAAMTFLYRVSKNKTYLDAAKKAQKFIENNLCEANALFVSYRNNKRGKKGFLDDYAFYIFALINLYEATFDKSYLEKALKLCEKTIHDFYDVENGGFWLYGKENEQLILRPKETYDGAIPSGNSVMAYNLVRLFYITDDKHLQELAKAQLSFMSGSAKQYPAGFSMFLTALSDYLDMPEKITVVIKEQNTEENIPCKINLGTIINVLDGPTQEYKLLNDKTTFYVCRNHSCMPPVNDIEEQE